MNKLFFIILFFPIWNLDILAQETANDSVSIDTNYVFKSLEEAVKNPDAVYHLKLSREKLKEVPEVIFTFKNLKTLDLSKNKLSSIPIGIANLTKLKTLKLNKNKFSVFPLTICQLTQLKRLEINQNSLVEIPPQIKNLQELVYLDMWSNELDVFPDELSELKKLKVFDLRVIQLSDNQQRRLHELLPTTKIHLSNSCNCAN